MKTYTQWLFVIIQLVVFSTASVIYAQAANPKRIGLTYCTFFSENDEQGQLSKLWAEEIEKRCKGKLKISCRSRGLILPPSYIYEGVLLGTVDIGMSAFSYNPKFFPAMQAIDLTMGYPDAKVATTVINDFYSKFRPRELRNVKVLYLHAHSPGLLHSKIPVHNLKELKRMKIRSTSSTAKLTLALGAIPIVKPQEYTYRLLSENYVDATWSPMGVLKGWRQAEVIKYTIETSCIGYTSGFYVVMNLKKWNSLPKDIQSIFDEVSSEWIPKHAEAWDRGDKEARMYTLDLGNKIIHLSKNEKSRWCETVQPVTEAYIKRVERVRLPGTEYVETIRNLIKKYKN